MRGILGLVAVAMICGACGSEPQGDDRVLSRVGSVEITVADVEAEIARRAEGEAPGFETALRRRGLLDEMILEEALVQRATAAGYAEDPEVLAAWRHLLISHYREDEMRARLADSRIDESTVRAAYEADGERFRTPERRRFAVVQIDSPSRLSAEVRAGRREKTRRLRDEAIEIAGEQAGFGALARRHSQHRASRYKGGDAGWITQDADRSTWPESLHRAVFSAESTGAIPPVVESPEAFFVVRVLEIAPAERSGFDEVRERIRQELEEQRRRNEYASFVSSALSAADVRNDDALIDEILPGTADSSRVARAIRPPALPE